MESVVFLKRERNSLNNSIKQSSDDPEKSGAEGHSRPNLTIELISDDSRFRRQLSFKGREAWCLWELIKSGRHGITSLAHPGSRLSHYIFKLRRAGVDIETTREPNTGAFRGTHGRYRLKGRLRVISAQGLGGAQ